MPLIARLIVARTVQAAISILAVTVLVFMIVRLTGDPVVLILPDTASEEDFVRLRAHYGLNEPLIVQYGMFLRQLASGDLGTSIRARGTPVARLISDRLPATLQLGIAALVIVIVVGVPAGVYAAYWRGGWLDRSVQFGAVVGQSAPQFWVGLILILVFAVQLRMVPAGGYGGPTNFVLPAVTVALPGLAGITRLTRSSVLEVLHMDYIKFARIKGVPEPRVLWKHALRNAALSIITYGGVLTAGLITGSVVSETVFAWPGLGQLMISSIQARDFPAIQAIVLIYSLIYIGVNFLVDLLYVVVNPRLRQA